MNLTDLSVSEGLTLAAYGLASMPRKLVFSLGHELLLLHCDVCTALFAPVVDDTLALELYKLHKSLVRTIHGPWN